MPVGLWCSVQTLAMRRVCPAQSCSLCTATQHSAQVPHHLWVMPAVHRQQHSGTYHVVLITTLTGALQQDVDIDKRMSMMEQHKAFNPAPAVGSCC